MLVRPGPGRYSTEGSWFPFYLTQPGFGEGGCHRFQPCRQSYELEGPSLSLQLSLRFKGDWQDRKTVFFHFRGLVYEKKGPKGIPRAIRMFQYCLGYNAKRLLGGQYFLQLNALKRALGQRQRGLQGEKQWKKGWGGIYQADQHLQKRKEKAGSSTP